MFGCKVGNYTAIDCHRTKFPWSSLKTVNQVLSGVTSDYHKKIFIYDYHKKTNKPISSLIKVRSCYQVSMHLWVFLVTNLFRKRSRRRGDVQCLRTWEATSTIHIDVLWWWNTLKRRPWLYTLDFYTKAQVWGRMVRTSSHVPFRPKTILVKRKRKMI